jgi:cbb3-type cytochrome oxidase subunit 3
MSHLLDLLSTYGLFLGIPILFLLVVFWIYRPGAARRYRKDALMPFEGGEEGDKPPAARASHKQGKRRQTT